MVKPCAECGRVRSLDCFNINKASYDGLTRICGDCGKVKHRKWRRSKKGLINNMYAGQVARSLKRGHLPPIYSKEELHDWLQAMPLFHHLHHLWSAAGYDKMLVPSLDRLDNDEGYTFSNLRLVTWGANDAKAS